MARRSSFALACVALGAVGCDAPAVEQPSYVRVVLVDEDPTNVTDAAVQVLDDTGAPITSLCVKLVTNGAPASFDLERGFGASASKVVQVIVTAEGPIDGDTGADEGTDFACPTELPAAIGAPQGLAFGFCEGESRDLELQVGATCDTGCAPDWTCSAGLSTDGSACAPGECCPTLIAHACALLPSD